MLKDNGYSLNIPLSSPNKLNSTGINKVFFKSCHQVFYTSLVFTHTQNKQICMCVSFKKGTFT